MKKYVLLCMSLFLLTGCGKKADDLEVGNEYQKDYIAAINLFKEVMNYEYDMIITEGENVTARNVKYNKQGEFAALRDPEIVEVQNENGEMVLPKNAISYFDTQTSKMITYDMACGRGWMYEPINLTEDNDFGPYAQFLAQANAEKITKFENNIYYLEFDASEVKDAITNNQLTYEGKINIEVTVENDLFKSALIKFGDTKTVKLDFLEYANVQVIMEVAAQTAPRYTGGC